MKSRTLTPSFHKIAGKLGAGTDPGRPVLAVGAGIRAGTDGAADGVPVHEGRGVPGAGLDVRRRGGPVPRGRVRRLPSTGTFLIVKISQTWTGSC